MTALDAGMLVAGFALLLVALAAPLELTARGRRITAWLLERLP